MVIAHAAEVIAQERVADVGPTRRNTRLARLGKATIDVFLTFVPFVVMGSLVVSLLTIGFHHNAAYDLRVAFLPAAHAIVHGSSPYANPSDPSLAHQSAYVYPPFVAFLTAPLLLLGVSAAVVLSVLLSLFAVPAILFLAGVRDLRCYGLALVWAPTWNAIQNVNISLPIACALALAWRFRNSSRASGLLLGCAVAAKVFVWPLLIWPLAMGRRRVLGTGVISAAVLVLGSWAAIGFAGLSSYSRLLHVLTSYEETESYSISGALRVVGLGAVPARGIALTLTLALLALCVAFGRRGDDRRAFAAAVLAALASTPILWQHYLMLLLVALAVCRPRLSIAWFLPLAPWFSPFTGNGNVGQTLLVPVVAALVGAACLMPRDRSSSNSRARLRKPLALPIFAPVGHDS